MVIVYYELYILVQNTFSFCFCFVGFFAQWFTKYSMQGESIENNSVKYMKIVFVEHTISYV